jgi:hypothetical protein
MEFDITNLDRKLLLKALIAYANPVGLGIEEYNARKSWKENVDGLSDEECIEILYEVENIDYGPVRVLDYYKGQPIKLDIYKKRTGQLIAGSTGYDSRNGKYKFFEAMLETFLEDEIKITRKGYGHDSFMNDKKYSRPEEQMNVFKLLLKDTIKVQGEYGSYWKIDSTRNPYLSSLTKMLKQQNI